MKWVTNLDLNKNELQNAKVQNLAASPSSPGEGQLYYDATSHRLFCWNGTAWVGADAVGATMTGADIVAAINASASLIDNDNLSAGVNTAVTKAHDAVSVADTTSINMTLTGQQISAAAIFGTAAGTVCQGNDSRVLKSHDQNTDTGTTSSTFQLANSSSGPKLKNNAGELQVRNAADNAYADLRVNNLVVEGTTTSINSNEVNIGDNQILLNSDITTNAANSDGGIAVKRLMADNTTRKDAEVKFNNSTGKWETVSGAVTGTLVTAQIANKVTATIGDGAATSIAVIHNLNSRDCSVSIREAASPYAGVMCDWEFTDLNAITFIFAVAPTTGQYIATIVG